MTLIEQYIAELVANGRRADGRTLDAFRQIHIEKSIVEKAEGSARVRLGDTEVLAGVKMSVGEPFPDKPNEGVLIANAEFSPIASPSFETGPPKEDAIELARVVDRGIRESHAIETGKLCVEGGEKVWIVNLDLHIMNHHGNLIDACSLAALAALVTTTLPAYDGKVIDYAKKTIPLPVQARPIAVTVAKIGDRLVVDPTVEEEEVMGARLTVTTVENGNLCAMQKGGTEPLSLGEIEQAFELSKERGKEIRKLV